MKIELVEDWRKAWRLWSVQFAAIVGALPELLYRIAGVFENLLPSVSQPVLDNLPEWLRGACAVLALVAVLLRLIRQPAPPCPPAS